MTQNYPPPPPAYPQAIAPSQLGMSLGSCLLGSMAAPSTASLTMPHAGQVVPASRVLFGMQRLSETAAPGISVHWVTDLLATVFLAGAVVSLVLALFPRFCKQPAGTARGEPPLPQLPGPWLLAASLVVAIVALVPALASFTTPSWILVLVSLLAVTADYMWVVLHVCKAE